MSEPPDQQKVIEKYLQGLRHDDGYSHGYLKSDEELKLFERSLAAVNERKRLVMATPRIDPSIVEITDIIRYPAAEEAFLREIGLSPAPSLRPAAHSSRDDGVKRRVGRVPVHTQTCGCQRNTAKLGVAHREPQCQLR
ncbi:hypothetical protein HPB51_025241 [Rhipicephalus microplus]|uniref:Uncharacterized protein n=1 Tax=Rhipicephalus microplus TaxID=6941 RepID=A0A9J6EJS2_RHIMP|nr:hypothetical protein HPB51_025241 [Rhipicephalus microplus]